MSKRARKEKVVVDPRRELNRSFLEAAYGGTIEEVKFYLDAGLIYIIAVPRPAFRRLLMRV